MGYFWNNNGHFLRSFTSEFQNKNMKFKVRSYLPDFQKPLIRHGKKIPSKKCLSVDSIGNRGEMLHSVYFGDYSRAGMTLWKRETFNAKNQAVQLFITKLRIHYGQVLKILSCFCISNQNFSRRLSINFMQLIQTIKDYSKKPSHSIFEN